MNDMSRVIIPKSDQINAEDFLAGPQSFTIEGVAITPGVEQPVSIKLAGEKKVWRPCKSMSRCLVAAWGPDASVYNGRSVTLYRDPGVKWGGMEVGGIRISHMSHLKGRMVLALTATKGNRKPHTIDLLTTKAEPEKAHAERASDAASKMTARDLLDRIQSVASMADLEAVTSDPVVMKMRGWLKENKPETAEKIDAAVSDKLDELAGANGGEEEDA